MFVSSTFGDLNKERNILQAGVFPTLERYCAEREFQFQAIDLHWGVPGEAGLDHRTMRIRFDELRRSQDISRTGLPAAASAGPYHANGNLLSDGTNTYPWDARNRMVGISGGVSASFRYDPFGRRVSKTIGTTTTTVAAH